EGVPDSDELISGANPLDGIAPQLGVLASTGGPGTVLDLSVERDIAVAIGSRIALSFYDVSSPFNPTLLNRFAGDGNFNAVTLNYPFVLAIRSSQNDAALYRVDDASVVPQRLWTSRPVGARDVALAFGHAYVAGDHLLTYEVDTGDLVHEISTNTFVGI